MPGAYLYGWDAANSAWVKCLVNAEGKLIIDPSEIFENEPTDNEHGKAPDSDWAHDHAADPDAHHAKTVIPSGTKMLFKQGTAPSGWTFVSEDNDRVILNTSTEADGGSTGGSWQLPDVNGHAISESEMPSHNHSVSVSIGSADSSVELYGSLTGNASTHCVEFMDDGYFPSWNSDYSRDTGHSHSASGSAGNTGSDAAHAHSQGNSWRPAYAKVITCTKD